MEDPFSNPLRTVEGTFDGETFWGEDGKIYNVPPNYASKSKLVEGDRLKLYIQQDGNFVFKQISPSPRRREIGKVTGDKQVTVNGKNYNVLRASMTYYKAEIGDEAIVLLPLEGKPTWAALENIVKDALSDKELEL